jgi:hypothetical protein
MWDAIPRQEGSEKAQIRGSFTLMRWRGVATDEYRHRGDQPFTQVINAMISLRENYRSYFIVSQFLLLVRIDLTDIESITI